MKTPSAKSIQVRGARQHNLRNISVDIPRDQLTVITGLSGSGKSSLAFDTIFAEGQRRYVESLSVHARQLLDQLPKPDVDRIDGLCPTIAIEQRRTVGGPRSTVATTTEVYDFLRLLFARVGTPTCPTCGREIKRHATAAIVDELLALPARTRIHVLAPLVKSQRGGHADLLDRLRREGFVRARIDGEMTHLEDAQDLAPRRAHTIDAVIDRIALREGMATRLADSIELALRTGGGHVAVLVEVPEREPEERRYSSHFACAEHPEFSIDELTPRFFSFNSPHGACRACHGLGTVLEFDPDLLVPEPRKSLAAGAIDALSPGQKRNAKLPTLLREFCDAFDVSPEVPYRNLPEELREILLHGTQHQTPAHKAEGNPSRDCQGADDKASPGKKPKSAPDFIGVIPHLKERWEKTDSTSVKERLHAYLSEAPCRTCNGGRLCPEALAVRITGRNIAELCALSIEHAGEFFDQLKFPKDDATIAEPILREVRARLRFMRDVGVEYLTLDRASATLSGGEAQRIRLATQIGSGLVGVCYVLDEPTIGLHQRDSQRLVATLRRLTDAGNTVLVVEHDEEMIAAADRVIDIGPGAGEHGGTVVAEGTLREVLANHASATARYLTGTDVIELPESRRPRQPRREITVHEATANNLKGVTVAFPLGCFVCVTGVSGSGKSTLVNDVLLRTLWRVINGGGPKPGEYKRIAGTAQVDRVVEIDQSPIGRSPRSNPATYVGAFDLIRQLFAKTREAKIRGYAPSRFSFNVKGGRCEDCQGQGTRRIEMHFLPDVFVECGTCGGTRYNRETLEVRYRGKNIADVLNMRIEEATSFFSNFAKIRQVLRALLDVGLGYVTLGQSATTLSGGEAQRVKLAAELGKTPIGHTMYLLDEPTTGLHLADVHNLVRVLNRLVDLGHSMVVIEHNLDVIKMADYVIDLGPEGGDAGGYLVATGTPEEIAANPKSHTGEFLQPRLNHEPIITA
ncbi:MAG: excinuclease ABC subunit UvrA [Phycisphaerales bacterium]|nr:excinuclease ABC subunit UvrA [Phycisphaerales bacterium]